MKFTDAGGRVVVGAEAVGEAMHFIVADTGIGIPAEGLSRIGEPFVQLRADYDRDYEGAGLGLSLVRGLVGLHGGGLRLESVPGVGTRVTARLPLNLPRKSSTERAGAAGDGRVVSTAAARRARPASMLEKKIA